MNHDLDAASDVGSVPFRRSALPHLVFGLVMVSELFRLRLEWFWYLVQMSFEPLALLVFVCVLWDDPRASQYAVTGSLVLTMSTSAMLSLGQHVGWMKENNAYEHYAALPISRRLFVLAIATRGVLLALPSIMTVGAVGWFVLDIRITWLAGLIMLLGAYAMSGLGAFIGFWSKDARTASLATQVLSTIIVFLTPVYFPLERLPSALRLISVVMPTSYASGALRSAVAGAGLVTLWPQVAVLAGFAAVSLLLVPLRLPWRCS